MPYIDLDTSKNDTDLAHRMMFGPSVAINQRILAHLTWPSDDVSRLNYFVALQAAELGAPPSETVSGEEAPWLHGWARNRAAIIRDDLPPNVFRLLSDAPSLPSLNKEIRANFSGWATAGQLLLLVLSMEQNHSTELKGGASINKALFYLSEIHGAGNPGRTRKTLQKYWSRYKTVAPLAAAALLMSDRGMTTDIFENATPVLLSDNCIEIGILNNSTPLLYAKMFQKFGTTFKPHGQAETLLDPKKTWLIPDVVDSDVWLPDIEIQFPPFPREEIEKLKKYRAPRVSF